MDEKIYPLRLDNQHRAILDRLSQHWQASRAKVLRNLLELADKTFFGDKPGAQEEGENVSRISMEL